MSKSLLVFAVVFGMGALGCSGVEGDCETICDWLEDCAPDETAANCVDECVEDVEDADDACQDSVEELSSCLEDDDSCTSDSDCASEATNLFEDCADDFN